jgi:REP element-mobilizing transposase RayT
MGQPFKSRRGGPPHNPGVRELVSGKRRWSSPPNREQAVQGFRGWHERGYLPHRDEPGLIQFVTFHLADSYPEALRSEWEHLWEIEDDRDRRTQLESYLDKGHGSCPLRRPEVAKLVDDALRFFHGQRHDLRAWVVMPNHVHALFKVGAMPMSEVVEGWKKYTAHEVNKRLGRQGTLWKADYWDTFMRDAAHELKTIRYIETNPCKARLVLDPKEWLWSSARFRDEYGSLRL